MPPVPAIDPAPAANALAYLPWLIILSILVAAVILYWRHLRSQHKETPPGQVPKLKSNNYAHIVKVFYDGTEDGQPFYNAILTENKDTDESGDYLVNPSLQIPGYESPMIIQSLKISGDDPDILPITRATHKGLRNIETTYRCRVDATGVHRNWRDPDYQDNLRMELRVVEAERNAEEEKHLRSKTVKETGTKTHPTYLSGSGTQTDQ